MRLPTVLSALPVLAIAASAGADTVRSTFINVAPGESVTLHFNSSNINTRAGAYNFNRDLGNPGTYAGLTPTYSAFCIDITQAISANSTWTFSTYPIDQAPTSAAGPMGLAKAALLEELFGRFAGLLVPAAPNANITYAAFQLAVWEIVFDAGLNITAGVLSATAGAATLTQAQTFLNALDGTGPRMNLLGLDHPETQGYVVGLGTLIPAPGAAALFGLGGGLLAVRRRRS